MSSFTCRTEDCNKIFANASTRVSHVKKSGYLPQRKKTSTVPEFEESCSIFALHCILFINNVSSLNQLTHQNLFILSK